jgi:hypothetical protein
METREWIVNYINYGGDMRFMRIEADVNAEESEVINMAFDKNAEGLYSTDDIWKIAYVE